VNTNRKEVIFSMSKQAGIYYRVSTQKQAENDKASLPEQEADCLAVCKQQSFVVFDVYPDTSKYKATDEPDRGRMVEPGSERRDRPEYQRLCQDIREGKLDVVVVQCWDRLAAGSWAMAEIDHAIEVAPCEVKIVTAWSGDLPKFEGNLKMLFRQEENERRRQRVIMAGHYKLKSGKFFGGTPAYGYDYDKENDAWVLNPEEAPWVAKMFKWYAEEEMGPKEIRQKLLAGNAPQQRGTSINVPWLESTISQILKNRCYTGEQEVNWDGKTYTLKVPQIVSEEVFNQAQERMAENLTWHPNNTKLPYMLQGLLVCGDCGGRMYSKTVRYRYGRNGQRFKRDPPLRYYHCKNSRYPERCSNKRPIPANQLEESVWSNISKVCEKPEIYVQYVQKQVAKLKADKADRIAEAERLKRELSSMREERQRVVLLFQKGHISEAKLDREIADIDLRLSSAENAYEMARLQIPDDATIEVWERLITRILKGYYGMLHHLWQPTEENWDEVMESRRNIVQSLTSKIVIYPGDPVEYDLYASAFLKSSLTDPDLKEMCQQINMSMTRQWRETLRQAQDTVIGCASRSRGRAT
jgi:site-specific DNA recombinase